MKNLTVRQIAFCAVIAAVYAALTIAEAGFAYGEVQIRIAEALCVLPFFAPVSMWGLFVGCVLANLVGGAGPLDVIFGSLATLLAAWMASRIKIKWLVPLPAVVINMLVIGAVLAYVYYPGMFWSGFGISALGVGAGQLVACFGLGLPLILLIERTGIMDKIKINKLR